MYCSLMKVYPWLEDLSCPSKKGVGALSSVSTFNKKRAPM